MQNHEQNKKALGQFQPHGSM
jgi:hypothetical protein